MTEIPIPAVGAPFIDVDEWRDTPRRHRYVHGGFENTHTRFSFYFPPEELYSGRLIQYLEGGAGGHENLIEFGYGEGAATSWMFDLAFDELGAYLVESNQGHFPGEGRGFENTYYLYDASADSAVHSKALAAEMYGAAPHHSYVWGVSGGGARSGQCLENRPDVWDGAAPHAGIGQDSQWSPWALLWLVARERFDDIIDATEPGGSGNPFAELSHLQREALADMYRRGYPRGAENQLSPFMAWAFPWYALIDHDPTYIEDFWNQPGYLGHDHPELLAPYVLSERTTVTEVVPASKVNNIFAQMAVRLGTAGAGGVDPAWGIRAGLPDTEPLFMSTMQILTGKNAGKDLVIVGTEDDVLSPFTERTPGIFEDVEVGDEVLIQNKGFIAFCFYHRYAALEPIRGHADVQDELAHWAIDGAPVYPQRDSALQPVSEAAPSVYKADFAGKMIYVQPTHDAQVWPTTIGYYERLVRQNLGERADEQFRVWYVENSPHATPEWIGPVLTMEKDPGVWKSRLVCYDGVSAQALRALIAWCEDGVAPPEYHGVHLDRYNALVLPDSVGERGGVQPLVWATANHGARAEVSVGEAVELAAVAEQPSGVGTFVRAQWDFEGRGRFEAVPVNEGETKLEVRTTHTYDQPGTYFVAFHVGAHLLGSKGQGPTLDNLARVRVVVI